MDDILTYSDDNSQNNSVVKSLSKQNIDIKEEKKPEAKPQTINSFNSEITLSFLKEKSNINELNKEKKISKSADFLTSPYGPPSNNARYYKIPNDLVGLVIGTNGETVRKIATESHCKIQVGKAPIPNSSMRYIFIEGTDENYRIATGMIDRVIASKK